MNQKTAEKRVSMHLKTCTELILIPGTVSTSSGCRDESIAHFKNSQLSEKKAPYCIPRKYLQYETAS